MYLRNENAKQAVEDGNKLPGKLYIRVSEEDFEVYKVKCLGAFALAIGLLGPGEDIVDLIHKF